MVTKLIKNWFKKSEPSQIAQILSTQSMREELLGVASAVQPTQEQILADANKIVAYSTKSDYAVWSKEAWAKALSHLDAIQDPKSTSSEVDFHRGSLRATLDLLRISYQARSVKESLENEAR
jgi:hypothetical protein